MRVEDIGERWVVEYIVKRLAKYGPTKLPIGDDAAAEVIEGTTVLSIDMTVWGTDAPPGMTEREFGFKAVTSSVSDLAAKGARPHSYLVSLGLRAEVDVESFYDLWAGIEEAVDTYGGRIVGGDVSETPDLIIDCAAIGVASRVVSRSGARTGDLVAVTGRFGAHAAGLRASMMGRKGGIYEELKELCFKPRAKVLEGATLAERGLVTAMTDSSDGLAVALYNIARASMVDIVVEEVPVHELAREFVRIEGGDLYELALHGGEEFELVMTLKPDDVDAASKALEALGSELIVIGRIVSGAGRVYARWGNEVRFVEERGWSHFVSRT